ncbi:MAG: hypothetical protein ACFFAH_05140 [Promethearchaeota archaeon]
MSNNLRNLIIRVQEYFNDFKYFFELEDFRTFLLFTLTSQVPSNVLAQLGMGGNKDIISLPYNPIFNIYYQKINLIASGSLIVYIKSNPINKDNFILEKDNPIFKNYLYENEMSLAFRGKEKFIFPKVSDCSAFEFDDDKTNKLNVKVDDYFHSLESFIAILEPNIIFVLNGKDDSEPDLLFTFNMMPEFPGKFKKNVFKIDVCLDNNRKTKDMTYLKREEDYKLTFLEDIKEVSHADLYKSSFSLIINIKSLEKPF